MYRIFLVEDDEVIAGAIADGLTRWGFEPYICNDFQNVTEEFLACDPHLTLLDISLPFYNGYHWCSEIRKISKTPIMFISSADDDMNIIMAINMGGDDFVAKPFEMQVLLTKIQALLRRSYDFNAQQETGRAGARGDPTQHHRLHGGLQGQAGRAFEKREQDPGYFTGTRRRSGQSRRHDEPALGDRLFR